MNTIRNRLAHLFRPVTRAIAFVRRHRPFLEALFVGLIVALVLSRIPLIGKIAGEFTMLAAALIGLANDERQ
ncbi:MAG: hypothetical protein K8T26_11165 [Lentisphaerae bacterium]|nr:hypothetical protein [Lentisphaerota bacterium]